MYDFVLSVERDRLRDLTQRDSCIKQGFLIDTMPCGCHSAWDDRRSWAGRCRSPPNLLYPILMYGGRLMQLILRLFDTFSRHTIRVVALICSMHRTPEVSRSQEEVCGPFSGLCSSRLVVFLMILHAQCQIGQAQLYLFHDRTGWGGGGHPHPLVYNY